MYFHSNTGHNEMSTIHINYQNNLLGSKNKKKK